MAPLPGPEGSSFVAWQPKDLQPLFEQLVPTVETMAVQKLVKKTEEGKLYAKFIEELEQDAKWPVPAKKTLEMAAPEVSAKWLNKFGISAENRGEVLLAVALVAIVTHQVKVTNRLDKLIALHNGNAPKTAQAGREKAVSDWTLPPSSIMIAGMTGSGKTTFALRYLVNVAAACRFFCLWAYDCARRGPGKKVFLADEVWRWCSPQGIPKELATLAQMGRAENLELVTATQLPHKVHAGITGQSTEIVCFRLNEPLALNRVQELGLDAEEIRPCRWEVLSP